MFKKFLNLLVIMSAFFCVSHAMNRNIPSVEVGGVARAGHPEFFASFARPDAIYFSAANPGVFFSGDQPIVDRVPLIGHYQNPDTKKKGQTRGDQYNGRVRVALVEFDKAALSREIPESVRSALAQAKITDLSKVEFYANILGNFFYFEQAPFGSATNSCNVAFHPIVRRWRGSGYADFNIPVQAGIFEPNGISPRGGGIAFGSLGHLDVHYHDREAFSPDNGRFNFDPQRGIVTFWVVGVYGGNVNVTFTIMANNEIAESLLLGVTIQDNFAGVLRVLNRTGNALSGQDMEALRNAVGVLQKASGQKEITAPSFVGSHRKLGGTTSSSVRPESRSMFIATASTRRRLGAPSAADAYIAAAEATMRRGAVQKNREPKPSTRPVSRSMFGQTDIGAATSSSAWPVALSQKDQENLDDMARACEQLALSGDIASAQSLLTSIRALDPERAQLCEFMLAS